LISRPKTRALVAVTADVASEKVAETRRRLAEALDNAKDLAGRARDQALDYAKATDETLHEHPHRAMGIAFGIGALLACLFMRQRSRGCN
jgi:ElaB/YqjD/DUF883 family membrane-anchored ribosome-binding protein